MNNYDHYLDKLIKKLYITQNLNFFELLYLLKNINNKSFLLLQDYSMKRRVEFYEKKVYLRAIIEISNFCKKNCIYCGIRKNNKNIFRYRLSKEEILSSVKNSVDSGINTVVIQSGEDDYYTDQFLVDLIKEIKKKYSIRVTLSLGVRPYDSLKSLRAAGADRYLLRHETIENRLFMKLHGISNHKRIKAIRNLKKLDYQVGSGFMIGIKGQTLETICNDLLFLKRLNPEMVGIGPFISHKDTPLKKLKNGDIRLTLTVLAITRLLLPKVLLPATTALFTIENDILELALKSSCNVYMPNLSPEDKKEYYQIYEDKVNVDKNYKDVISKIKNEIKILGYDIDLGLGDHYDYK